MIPAGRKLVVSPEHAAELLKRNTHNRPVDQHLVRKYTALMSAGQWLWNGDTIRVAASGEILDGQHRLLASTVSAKPFTTILVEGLPSEVFTTIDTQKPRTARDVLTLAGIPDAPRMASAARWVGPLSRGEAATGKAAVSNAIVHQACLEWVELAPCLKLLDKKKSSGALFPPCAAAILAVASRLHGHEKVASFVEAFDGGLTMEESHPVLVLRNRLTTNRAAAHRMHTYVVMAVIIKALNAYLLGKSVGTLKYGRVEEYPIIVGVPRDK